ncbi:28S ribosomal protein S18b, mitochondrial [Bombina bombina]|uniref:28S ribosomal protein S18b, mitochondrial n=1 Tax=Bombina bombina TaxID=8345 RepID=UPI00235AA83A|nr:28S ribosomal protein S18b, mitochondrial [Bombina bombina]
MGWADLLSCTKMAAAMGRLFAAGIRGVFWGKGHVPTLLSLGTRPLTTSEDPFDVASRYKDQPWEYLTSEEYVQRYGSQSVWTGYRRNHKGPIPPQKTRKTCIRGGKVCGNPCPICRDQKLGLDYRNVRLLQQFICPHTGVVFDPTKTGVCMKQQKILVKAITDAKDHGFLPASVPHLELRCEDYLNNHGAVSSLPPPPEGPWYDWYEWREPPIEEIKRLKKLYKPYLKEMESEK